LVFCAAALLLDVTPPSIRHPACDFGDKLQQAPAKKNLHQNFASEYSLRFQSFTILPQLTKPAV
jgi:hypothetical protein